VPTLILSALILAFYPVKDMTYNIITDSKLPFNYQHNIYDCGKCFKIIDRMTRSITRTLRKIRSVKIQNKIGAGKTTYFVNPLEEIAFKYIPGESGKPGKYYAKYYGQNEIEINYDSSSILMAVMEGKPISKAKYNRYQLGESGWDRDIKTSATYKVVSAYYNASEWLTREFSRSGK
jgi:hypothetical protein